MDPPWNSWIERAPGRGELGEHVGGLRLWEVPESDLRSVSNVMSQARVIFDWRTYD
jgi:hypothetical protein